MNINVVARVFFFNYYYVINAYNESHVMHQSPCPIKKLSTLNTNIFLLLNLLGVHLAHTIPTKTL